MLLKWGYSCDYAEKLYMAGKYDQCDVLETSKYFYATFIDSKYNLKSHLIESFEIVFLVIMKSHNWQSHALWNLTSDLV